MLNSTSAFAPGGSGLYLGATGGGYTGSLLSSSYGGSSYGGSRVTTRVASYLRQEYSDTIQDAQRYLAEGDFNKAMQKIESLREHAKDYSADMGQSIDDEQISTALNRAGADFDNYIDENSKGAFATGLFNGIPLIGLFCDSYSKGEVQAKLNNDEVRMSDKIGEGIGKVISGGGTGAAIGAFAGPIGALIGFGIGTALAFGQNAAKEWVMNN